MKEIREKTQKVLEDKEKLKNSKDELLEKFKKEQEELDRESKTPEQYIKELKKDWDNLIKFESIRDQKEYLDIRRELENFKKEVINSRKVTANDKNKLTS
jgi:glutathione synthase/RimK-type ligase-like ATP-grasp enzyme